MIVRIRISFIGGQEPIEQLQNLFRTHHAADAPGGHLQNKERGPGLGELDIRWCRMAENQVQKEGHQSERVPNVVVENNGEQVAASRLSGEIDLGLQKEFHQFQAVDFVLLVQRW